MEADEESDQPTATKNARLRREKPSLRRLRSFCLYQKRWSEWRDSNPRPLVPQTSALTGLRHAPTAATIGAAPTACNAESRFPARH